MPNGGLTPESTLFMMIGEDVQQHRKTRWLTRAAVVALAGLLASALVAAVLGVRQRNIAEQERTWARRLAQDSSPA